jgi:integrase
MADGKQKKGWERTNVTNLVRNGQSGIYYARVKVNGKDKWRSLKTARLSVAKLKLADVEKEVRAQGQVAVSEDATAGSSETTVQRFIGIYRTRTTNNSSLASATKSRRDIAVKALVKTWPELPYRDARRVTPTDCQQWAVKAFREGTGFVAPKAKTVRKGMSGSAFNKCVESLSAVFEIAIEHGAAYSNPAKSISKATLTAKRLDLPTIAQFQEIVKAIAEAGARQSKDCADMVRLLAYSGARLKEATALRWSHVDSAAGTLTIPGTKSASSYRTVPIVPPLAALLEEIRGRRGREAAEAQVLGVNECMGALETACRNSGIKTLTHHDLRHLFATRCIESGVDIPTVSRWLGHADGGALAMKTYGHLRNEHSKAQAAKVSF